jgi:DNA-nicking Smr family endonuclease
MKRRTTSEEERKLFEQNFREALPLKAVPVKQAPKSKGTSKGPSGVNGATQDRLRRGLVEPDARIDLHGMTQGSAHRALFTWLAAAHSRGFRLVLVITWRAEADGAALAERTGAGGVDCQCAACPCQTWR